jgi:glycosyltransferase involved in cell wall biosynthesis
VSIASPPLVATRRGPPSALTVGIVSTYPPTACGLATFSAALARGLAAVGAEARVVRIADGEISPEAQVVGELASGSPSSIEAAARLLNECDVAVLQHEYGIYGGTDGDEVLQLLEQIHVPTIVVAHTILLDPSPYQRTVLVDVIAAADQVVVMSESARERLCTTFDVDASKVITIPHGAAVPAAARPNPSSRPLLLTWGLLGPGKGIERVIDALPTLRDIRPRPNYLVAGRTHPKVLAADGEAYRNARIEQSWRKGVAASVRFDADYRDVPSLTALIQSAAVVVLPYDSCDQVTSGVLVDAIAAGRPVVATAFPHAIELLGTGAGIVVDHDDPDAMAIALRRVLTDSALAARMADEAERLAPDMAWPVVAGAYLRLAEHLLAARVAVA